MIFSRIQGLIQSRTFYDSLVVLGGSGFSSVLGFVFVSLVAREMGPTNFGVFSTIFNYFVFLSAVLDLGISQSLVRFVPRTASDQAKRHSFSTSLFTVLISAGGLGLVAAGFYEGFLRHIWHHPSGNAMIIWLTIVVICLAIYSLSVFQALGKFWQRSIVDNIFSVVRLIVIGVILSYGVLSIRTAMISIILGYLASLLVAYTLTRFYFSHKAVQFQTIGPMLRFSRWLGGVSFLANLYGKIDIMMLAWLSTPLATGIYSAGSKFILVFPLVVSSVSSVIATRYSNFDTIKKLDRYFYKTIGLVTFVNLVLALLLILARPLVLLAFDEAFEASVPVFRGLILASFPLIWSIPPTNAIIYFFKKPEYITSIAAIQLIGLILLNYWLIPRYQTFGPVYSLAAMNTLGMLLQYGVYLKLKQTYV